MQAGGLDLPKDFVLLPGTNEPNSSFDGDSNEQVKEMFFVSDFVFLIEHSATGDKHIFDLGMRKSLENSPPALVKYMLPKFNSFPE